MSGCLIDTNVISELTKASPDSGVVAFLSERDDLWLSSVVVHELEFSACAAFLADAAAAA